MKLLVLDGNSILNRAFYGIKLLTTKQGEFTNGIYGFLTMMRKLLDETTPDAVAIAFDMRAPTFRHKAYEGYKAQRKGMPEELAQQMPVLQELLKALGYKIVLCEGWEADDILGTLAAECEKKGDTCIIATGDRDSLQLVSDKTSVRLATTKGGKPTVTFYDEEKVMEEYGVKPVQLIDIKAIQGDSSDNIPGVAGIGPKGAGDLIQKYQSLDYIYEHMDELEIRENMRKKLIESKDNAILSYSLGTIQKDAPVDTAIDSYVRTAGEKQKADETMVRLELFSLRGKFDSEESAEEESGENSLEIKDVEVEEITNPAAVLAMAEDAGKAYFCAQISASSMIEKLCVSVEDKIYLFEPTESFLKAFLGNAKIEKYTHEVKPLHKAALKLGLSGMENVKIDTILAAYLLNPSASGYDVERLAAEYGVAAVSHEDILVRDTALLSKLCTELLKEIDENNQRKLLDEIEIPLALVLAKMEHVGFYVDRNGIEEYGNALSVQIQELQHEIVTQVGYEFNINSPKQLGKALFEDLGLPHGKKTKTGWSTSADVLEYLRNLHPVVAHVLDYRALTKLKSTYCDGLLKVIAEDGRIHSNFNQTETRTGRISSTEPNLQNIPVRTERGRELRKFFAAESGYLVDADYSQIELRVLAHVAEDSAMQEDFLEGRDIHTATAARVFGMPVDMVTSEMRGKAKAVNFGIVYGIGAYSLSGDIGVSVKEADAYIKEYLRNYAGVDEYMKKVVAEAKEKGYVQTLFDRRRYLPELKSSNFNMRSFGERVARNMPIQGAAADIIKIAMIRVTERLEKEKLEARLILQVHDELIVEAPEHETETVKKVLEEEMVAAVSLSVPMKADAGVGRTWYESKA